ncbi:1-acyl-sn-glycerol-3-phosphate acyltransferase [Patescibacteria group bacterium]|nr:1-acyl-sn-glycerol-3-phosphate acyltransferase [Patescibacteria group bacterium]
MEGEEQQAIAQALVKENQPSGNLYLKVLVNAWLQKRTFGNAAQEVLERSQRPYEIVGEENIPKEGPFILAGNHYVRAEDPKRMTGEQKMNDLVATIGLINTVVERNTENARILWTPSETPRPEGQFPKGKPVKEVLQWLTSDAKFAGANAVRKAFFSMFGYSNDILVAPSSTKSIDALKSFYKGVTKHFNDKGVLGIFPEGEVTQEMRQAKPGLGHLAIRMKQPVLPVAIYDEGGTLKLRIGKILSPPDNITQKDQFTTDVMTIIAGMLPENLRGFYKQDNPTEI